MDLATNEKPSPLVTVEGQDSPTNDLKYSSQTPENNGYIDQIPQTLEVTIAAHAGTVSTWLWCSTCSCLTNAALFDACAVCGRATDQLEKVDEITGRARLEVAS